MRPRSVKQLVDLVGELHKQSVQFKSLTDSTIGAAKKLLASGVPLKDVAKNLSVSVPTL